MTIILPELALRRPFDQLSDRLICRGLKSRNNIRPHAVSNDDTRLCSYLEPPLLLTDAAIVARTRIRLLPIDRLTGQ